MAGVEIPLRLESVRRRLIALHGGPRQLLPAEMQALQRLAEALRAWIRSQWPVDTATSRDAWEVAYKGSSAEISITLYNDVDYVEWVHLAGTPEIPPLWEDLQAELPAIAGDLLPALTAAIERGERDLRRFAERTVAAPLLRGQPTGQRVIQNYIRESGKAAVRA